MLTTNENVERVKNKLDAKIADVHRLLGILNSKEDTTEWTKGLYEGQVLTLEYVRRELENDETIRGEMLDAVLNRLVDARS